MSRIKQCPFCGGNAKLIVVYEDIMQNYYGVKCIDCGTFVETFNTQTQAINFWNNRVEVNDNA